MIDSYDLTKEKSLKRGYMLAVIAVSLIVLLAVPSCNDPVQAETISLRSTEWSTEEYCQAIYWAEGGAKTKHPYGILAKYKHTTPKKACLNTVNHKYAQWNGKGEFLTYLAPKYCPINSNTDNGTCKFWPTNVKWYLEHQKHR